MKRKYFAVILSACLALTMYSPLGASAESMFSSEISEDDEGFTAEAEEDDAADNCVDEFADGTNFIAETEPLETYNTEDEKYTDVNSSIEFRYVGTTLEFRLKDGATDTQLPNFSGTGAGAIWKIGDMESKAQNVTKIDIGEGITAIGNANFCLSGSTGSELFAKLAEVDVPSSLTSIGFGAFQGDAALTKFEFKNVTSIGASAFASSGLAEVSITSENVTIGSQAFYNCKNLTSVTMKNLALADKIFCKCSSLSEIKFNNGIVSIPQQAFRDTSLSAFDFDGVENIGNMAFRNAKLSSVSLPNIKTIGSNVFAGNPIENISIGNAESTIANGTFGNYSSLKSICYAGSREQWKNLTISASVPESVQIHCKADSVEPKAATCIETGLKEVGECKVCGEHYSYADNENVLPVDTVNGHNWSEDYVVDQEATCTEPGSKSKHCTREGCDAKNDTQEIKALGHDYVSKVTKEATCTEKGILTKTCSRCNDVVTEEIQALGHDFAKDYTVDVKATCTTDGKQSKHCARCDAKTDEQKIPALGHDFTSKVTKEATCTADGVITKSCSRCDATETEAIKATGHKFGDWKVTIEATVFVPEQQERICETCGEKETKTVGTALKATATVNVSTLKLKVKQSTSGLKIAGLAKGDSVKTWKSTNTKIFTVKGSANGTCKVTAKKAGTAKLQITLASGLKKTVTVKVQKSNVKTTKVSVSSKNVSVKKGKKVTLKPVVTPFTSKQKVTYTSSNKKVATVSAKGVVTGKKKGTAKITIKSGSKSVKVTVRVK